MSFDEPVVIDEPMVIDDAHPNTDIGTHKIT